LQSHTWGWLMGAIIDVLIQAMVLIRTTQCGVSRAQAVKLAGALCDVGRALAKVAQAMETEEKPEGFTLDLPLG
jgi:hypothetical protein